MRRIVSVIVVLALALVANCARPAPTSTPVVSTTAPTSMPAAPTQAPPTAQPVLPASLPAGNTAGELAKLGNEVYKKSCSVCHDEPFAGNLSNSLVRFANAQQMFNYMRQNMPQGQPGTLKPEQYLQVLASVLVEGKVVAPNAVLDINKLADIPFPK